MKGLVLAAGLGTRLRPITEEIAKPSLPILGVPTFWFSATHLSSCLELKTLALNFSHAPDTLITAAKDQELIRATDLNFHLSDETSEVLGSSGALWKLSKWIGKETLAVTNGDSIETPDWNAMVNFHRESDFDITLHLRPFTSKTETYTDVAIDKSGKVLGLGEKRKKGVMFTGAYLIEPSALERLPEGPSELRPTLLEPLLGEGKLGGFIEDGHWLDTGTPETYAAAQFELLDKFPQFSNLVDLKMKEIAPRCWVPQDWGTPSFRMKSPAVLYGRLGEWEGLRATAFGPNFVGLKPPRKIHGPHSSLSNQLVWADFSKKL